MVLFGLLVVGRTLTYENMLRVRAPRLNTKIPQNYFGEFGMKKYLKAGISWRIYEK